MAIVDVDRLNRFLGSPVWRDDQMIEAADMLDEVEDSLAAALNTKITPVEHSERAAILSSGLVATSYPVFAVSKIDGTTVPENGPLPSGWLLQDHYLRMSSPPTGLAVGTFSLDSWPDPGDRTNSVGAVSLVYQAGLGNVPALRKAILRKTAAFWDNRQSETVTVRDLDASQAPGPAEEEWTERELANLSRFYNHVVWK